MFSSEIRGLEELRGKIKKEIENTLGIAVKVSLIEPKTLQRSEGKAVRVTDKRVL